MSAAWRRARRQQARPGSWAVAVQVGQFALAGAATLLLVGYATSLASRRVGEREAIVDARATTVVKAQDIVEPAVSTALLDGDLAARNRLDRVVRREVLDDSLVRVRIWALDGTILYSDEPRAIGLQYPLGDEHIASVETGLIDAEVSDLTAPENVFERQFGKLLEVYLPIHAPNGEPLLFEAYYRYDVVEASGRRLWRSFAPISLGALALLQLVQIPLAWSLARRLRQRLREREGLLRRALEASEHERRQIASDLHDGVVQDLAGVAYALAAAARNGPDAARAPRLYDDSAATVRESVKTLRSLLVDIYPPNLAEEGLPSALSDLLARTSGRGVMATLDTSELADRVPTPVAGLLFRAAQEAVRNVLKHADATTVHVRVRSADDVAALEVVDDGRGFEPAQPLDASDDGHFGLRGLAGLVEDAGGAFEVESSPGTGTTLRVEVPW